MIVQLQDDVRGPNTAPIQTVQHSSNRNLDVVFGYVLCLCANEDEMVMNMDRYKSQRG